VRENNVGRHQADVDVDQVVGVDDVLKVKYKIYFKTDSRAKHLMKTVKLTDKLIDKLSRVKF